MNPRRSFDRLTLLTALTAIGAYCVAEGNAPMAIVALPAAALAWWLRGRAFAAEVPRVALNLILVAIIAYAILKVLDQPIVSVDDVARLILILLIVKLFDRQSVRDAAQAISLSLFLAIAAMLTSVRLELGLLLIPMVPMLIAATMHYQVQAGYEAAARSARSAHPSGVAPPRFIVGAGWRRQLRMVAGVSAVAIVLVAGVVFVLVPRGMNAGFMSRWGAPSASVQTRFTSTVQLGRGGFLSESQRAVMQMTVTDGEDGLSLGRPDRVFYLRGNILDDYDPESYAWKRAERSLDDQSARKDSSITLNAGEPFQLGNADGPKIVQHITLLDSAQGQRFLFSMQRPVLITFDNRGVRLAFNMIDRRIVLTNDEGELRYTVQSLDPERQFHTPWRSTARPRVRADFPSDRIRALASEVLISAGLDPDWENRDLSGDSRACRAIQSYLRSSRYRYTTRIQAPAPGTDPIEWFLLEHKEGHCEYFASAMAAMCRSVGIPTRVIAGYVAAEWNEASGSYIVRESNAHAWVECEVADNDWRTFDPTPPSELLRLHRPPGGVMTKLRHLLDAMEHAWITSVVTYDQGSRQRIFKEGIRGADDWFASLSELVAKVQTGGLGLILRGIFAGAAVFAVVAVGGQLVQVLVSRRRRRARAVVDQGESAIPWREQTGFYPRLLEALRRRGAAKPSWSPPLQHALTLADADPAAADAAARIASHYYAARFGVRRLTSTEVADAELALRTLAEQPLAQPNTAP